MDSLRRLFAKPKPVIARPRVISIQLDITNACNLACEHCYHSHHRNAGNLEFPEWLTVLDQYQELLEEERALANIVLCGGEPLLSPHLVPIIENITRRWPDTFVGILTNGTRIDKVIDSLKGHPLYFQVSLEGPTELEHDRVRGRGSYKSMMKGVALLREHHFDVHCTTVLSRDSAEHIERLFQTAREVGFKSINFTRAIPQGSGKKRYGSAADASLLGQELRQAYQRTLDAAALTGVSTNTNKPLFALLDSRLGGERNEGSTGFVVDYQGNYKVSSRADLKIGNFRDTTLTRIYHEHPLLIALRDGFIEGCADCKHFARCGGDRNYAYATSGNFLGFDQGCWFKQREIS